MTSQKDEFDHPDDIVISGISGVFPDSENLQQFGNNLFSGKDMIKPIERYGTTVTIGAINTIDRFDHTFFHLTRQHAEGMTIGSRIVLEKTFEAILDAGYNPQQIKGKNIAVVFGIWDLGDEGDPAKETSFADYNAYMNKYQFMVANRISNFLDLHGPSCVVNTACSSSMYALDMATKYIQNGQCEGAIVCASNFCFCNPEIFVLSPLMSSTGISAPFDANASTYVRSEAVVSLFLQKRKYARRVYANVIHSTTNCDGFKEEGFAYPSISQQIQLYEQFYNTANIDPKLVSYIEAHGTGTRVGDVVEGTSIEEFFCKGRTSPLKIGTVKSNMGHAESAAALCGIAKIILAFHSGIIPPNLRFETPNPKIKGLLNGSLQVVTKPTPMEGQYIALNSFGIGGGNGHLLLAPHNKIKKFTNASNCTNLKTIPRIVTVSGRTPEAIDCICDEIEKNHKDEEYIALMHEIFSDDISGHLHRGYIILHEDKPHVKSKMEFTGEKRPIWFVFSGMGSQWPTMGKSLMNIPQFADSIQKSHQILLSKNIDLIRIITDDDPALFDNIINSFVGIAAIQIALVDVLYSIGIQPDGMIGHSTGELGCGYADGCFTAEQTILAAYYRGEVSYTGENISADTELIHGTMVAVGEGYETMKHLVPSEIDIACHNGPNSCTISGPTEIINQFIEKLKADKIFARRVNSANIAYHSRYTACLGEKLLTRMKQIIPERKLRSEKWICTSAIESTWNSDLIKYASAEYYTHNLLNTVFFEEGCHHIPSNALTIEIAPHGLLNAILQQSLPKNVMNVTLTMKNHENGVEFFLNSLGRLYEFGCEPKLCNIYPPVEFPVSRSTPMISSVIRWQHDEEWAIGRLSNEKVNTQRNFLIRAGDEKFEFIKDHIIDGRNLYPGLGYLWLVLETVAAIKNTVATKMPVIFENVRFERATNVPQKGTLNFHVVVHISTNFFEVTDERKTAVATGVVRMVENIEKEVDNIELTNYEASGADKSYLNNSDFYKELRLRGYQYKNTFKTVHQTNCEGTWGEILWNDNYVTFMDAMAQIQLFSVDTRELLVPTYIRKIVIDFDKHFQILQSLDKETPKFPVNYYPNHRLLSSGGIQMTGWSCNSITRQKNLAKPILQKYQFIPYIEEEEMDINLAIHICIDIMLENVLELHIKSYEILDEVYDPEVLLIAPLILDALRNRPLIQANITISTDSENAAKIQAQDEISASDGKLPGDKSATLIALSNFRKKIDKLESIGDTLKDDGFIITREPNTEDVNVFQNLGFNICFSRRINSEQKIILLNKIVKNTSIYKAVQLHNDLPTWIPNVQSALANIDAENEKIVIYAEKDLQNGILGFFNCIRREEKGKFIRCLYIMDEKASDFSVEYPFYLSQLDKNLSHNVYKNGSWGCYRHLPLEPVQDVKIAHAYCAQETRGNLSSFKWVEGSLNPNTYQNTNERSLIYIHYSSLNFRDIMLSIGKISILDTPLYNRLKECNQGFEFSGTDKNGVRLMGIAQGQAIATLVEAFSSMTWKVPDYMTLEEAATIPVVYSTVIYAFFFKMNLQQGSSILIHAGSGGIGQAAIQICLHYGCNIFTTVGSAEKVQFIRKTFPMIPESHIGNSRDTSFEKLIIQQTDGRGVDVVLNSLSEEKLQASVRCLAKDGHFLEIGKFDIFKKNSLELEHFANNISFHSVQLDITMETNDKLMRRLRDKLQDMLDQGIIKPMQRTIFQSNDVESAFRYMTTGKHIGKILIKIHNKEDDTTAAPKVEPRIICPETNSYLILGGLGGLGLELADWLITRGARNIVLSSRNGIKNGYQAYRIKLWRSYGVNVIISTEDVTKQTGVRNLLQITNSLGPVEGIFNLAVVLKDGEFSKQNEELFSTVVGPKAIATIHLDRLSRKMCPHLKHFVVFSSVTCGLGNANQSNYGYANSVMERICEKRHFDKLPALAIQWGAVGDVGIVAEFSENNTSIVIRGTLLQSIASCLEKLNLLMTQSAHPVVFSMVIAEKSHYDSDIIHAVANILGIKDLKTINQSWTLPELGMDSILGLELKQILDAEFNAFFTENDLRTMTFSKLYKMKEDRKNAIESGTDGNTKTQLEILINEQITKNFILQIPINDENDIEKPIAFDEKRTIFMFPGVEGLAVTMEPIARHLPGQVLCFQYHFDEDEDFSLQKLSNHFAKYILENYHFNGNFCFIGYSLGGLLAMEVVNILEQHGKIGYIYLIESSPLLYQKLRAKNVEKGKYSNEELLQNEVCLDTLQTLFSTSLMKKNEDSIKNMKSWRSKKQLCYSLIPQGSINEDAMNQVLDKIYKMSKALLEYDASSVSSSLESTCVLIRCVENHYKLDENYGLSKYFKNTIEVHQIDADHVKILHHPKTANIITTSPILVQ